MMPASAIVNSDDDDDDQPAGGPRRSTRDRSRVGSVGATPSGLAAIDITTPLEDGEVMPEAKPYVRQTAETAEVSGGGRGGGGRGDGDTPAKDSKKGDGRSRRRDRGSKSKKE
ncbi:unnamed protein product, partial [Laminaria digitata]